MSSFPNVIYGRFGDEKKTTSAQNSSITLGQKMILPDGREFAYAKCNSAAVINPGVPVVQKAVAGTSVNIAVATAAAIGATTVVLTMPATTLCTIVNQYAGGKLIVNDNVGEGHTYQVKESTTADASSTATFTLEPYDGIKVALIAATSEVTIREHAFYNVLERAAGTTAVGIPAGVPAVAVTAGYYCWLQRKGTAALLAGGTLSVAGRPFACCTVEASFQSWNPIPANTTLEPVSEPWGYTEVAAAASTEYFVGNLQLP